MFESWSQVRGLIEKARDRGYGRPAEGARRGQTRLKVSRESYVPWNSAEAIFCLVYHDTELIRWYPDGRESASLNGWDTVTTKDRISTHSRFHIGTDRGRIMGGIGGSRWPGDETTWFFSNSSGELCFEDGTPVPFIRKVKAATPIPKSRKPILNPKPGDAFQDINGNCWICWQPARHENGYNWSTNGKQDCCLIRYLGDHPSRSDIAITDKNTNPVYMSTLDKFVFSASTDWKVIPRFTWTQDNRNIPNQMRLF